MSYFELCIICLSAWFTKIIKQIREIAQKNYNVTCTVQFLQAVSECLVVEDTADRYNLAYY